MWSTGTAPAQGIVHAAPVLAHGLRLGQAEEAGVEGLDQELLDEPAGHEHHLAFERCQARAQHGRQPIGTRREVRVDALGAGRVLEDVAALVEVDLGQGIQGGHGSARLGGVVQCGFGFTPRWRLRRRVDGLEDVPRGVQSAGRGIAVSCVVPQRRHALGAQAMRHVQAQRPVVCQQQRGARRCRRRRRCRPPPAAAGPAPSSTRAAELLRAVGLAQHTTGAPKRSPRASIALVRAGIRRHRHAAREFRQGQHLAQEALGRFDLDAVQQRRRDRAVRIGHHHAVELHGVDQGAEHLDREAARPRP